MKVNAYLVITANRSRYYNSKNASLRITKGQPSLNSNEIALKLTIDVPDAVFTRPIPSLKLGIPESIVMNPDAEISTEIIAEEVADALQLDVKSVQDGLLEILKKKQEENNA